MQWRGSAIKVSHVTDGAKLPPEFRERVDVVGEQEDLTELPAQVAARRAK